MRKLTIVLAASNLPSLGSWNDELRESGFDVVLDPHPRYDDQRSVPVIVCGRDAVVEFEVIPASQKADWFPSSILAVQQRCNSLSGSLFSSGGSKNSSNASPRSQLRRPLPS